MSSLPKPQRGGAKQPVSFLFPVGSLYCHAFFHLRCRCRVFDGSRRFQLGSRLLQAEVLSEAGLLSEAEVLQAEVRPVLALEVLQARLQAGLLPEAEMLQAEVRSVLALLQAEVQAGLRTEVLQAGLQAELLQEGLQPV
jgi:hypothetical protein